eukprot:4060733-Alexandrium_andersonii.AAC.1
MSASLVGSEMCIRDRPWVWQTCCESVAKGAAKVWQKCGNAATVAAKKRPCLLYTSDATDDM